MSKTLTYVKPSRSRSSRSSRLYDRTPMWTTCSTPTWSAIRRAEQACDHLSERYESRKSRWASIPITPMSFGNARTTAGARLCSPPMTIGIFPARTTSAAMCVTPSTISDDAPKVGVSPRSATATSRRSRWWSIMYVSKLYEASRIARGPKREPPRNEHVRSYGTPNRAIHASSYFATASAKRGAAMDERKSRALIRGRPRSIGRELAPAERFDVHDLLTGSEFALELLGHGEFERLVRREVHQLGEVAVGREDLGLPLVDDRDSDLVRHRMHDRPLLPVEQTDRLEPRLRFAVFPRLRGLDRDDATRLIVDDDVPVHLQLSNLRLLPGHRVRAAM